MKRIIYILLAFVAVTKLSAQDKEEEVKPDGWSHKGSIGLNLTQTSLSNWSAGGDNIIGGNAYLYGGLDYKKGPWLWQNNLALQYGMTSVESEGTKKSNDNIEIGTQLGYTTDNVWYYSAMASFQSQFAKGYRDADKLHYISRFMAPGYLNISAGMEYKPANKFYSVYLSPVAGRFTFVNDDYLSDMGAFGVKPGKKSRSQFGAYVKGKAEKEIMENVKLITDASFFTAYDSSFGNIDVEWNMLISMKINKYLNASVNTSLRYFDAVKSVNKDGTYGGPKVQFKEVIGVGVGVTF